MQNKTKEQEVEKEKLLKIKLCIFLPGNLSFNLFSHTKKKTPENTLIPQEINSLTQKSLKFVKKYKIKS